MTRVVAVDVDGVCADLHSEWLSRYNRDFQDTLTVKGIHQWDMIPAVKPECGKGIYKYLNDADLYDLIPCIAGSQEGVANLRKAGYRVVFVTSCTRGMADQKWAWLERHGFLPVTKGQHPDLVIAHDKSLIRADLLIDDYDGNFVGWTEDGILLDAPYNANAILGIAVYRAYNWPQIVEMAA